MSLIIMSTPAPSRPASRSDASASARDGYLGWAGWVMMFEGETPPMNPPGEVTVIWSAMCSMVVGCGECQSRCATPFTITSRTARDGMDRTLAWVNPNMTRWMLLANRQACSTSAICLRSGPAARTRLMLSAPGASRRM